MNVHPQLELRMWRLSGGKRRSPFLQVHLCFLISIPAGPRDTLSPFSNDKLCLFHLITEDVSSGCVTRRADALLKFIKGAICNAPLIRLRGKQVTLLGMCGETPRSLLCALFTAQAEIHLNAISSSSSSLPPPASINMSTKMGEAALWYHLVLIIARLLKC